ncbi:MFS general substrate transporter like protein [Zymoseptoria brevis]|uniref:MFS general substrate transporter like protein n=1 Tax=Zymoseptoria brevis TaxID=1047168 RepID=A0A0F4GCN2_9PEZI|nr:MFS general substrate transporter like protein [Zymoseptoria brevis]
MQSIRQYRALGRKVAEEVAAGQIHSLSDEKPSVVDIAESDDNQQTTTSLKPRHIRRSDAPILVGWESPNDQFNPRNWSMTRRIFTFAIIWLNTFSCDWASSADSQNDKDIAAAFHVSQEAEGLSPSLYTFGIAFGALFAAPISETIGRSPLYVGARFLHLIWLIGVALAPNFGAQCAFRFLAGVAASQLVAVQGASIADLFGPVHRTLIWPTAAMASFAGTALSPVVGAWIAQSGADWRLAEWVAVIVSGLSFITTSLFLPETFEPIILSWRARHLRKLTGCERFQAEIEIDASIGGRLKTAILRAVHMLTREPIVILLGSWLALSYLVIYCFLQGFTFIFGKTYGFSRGLIGTSFIAIAVGALLWYATMPYYYRLYKSKVGKIHEGISGSKDKATFLAANSPGVDLPDPEYRLWLALLAAPAFPISLFWLGWTSYASISPWSNLGAVVLLGFSWAGVYVTVYQYILDTYGTYAGSALAIITNWRYLVSGAINLVARPMYSKLGVNWTMTMVGSLATIQMFLPVVFYFYGSRIRKRSSFAGQYVPDVKPLDRQGKDLSWR